MLERNTQSSLLHASKNIILYQWTGLENYIWGLVWIGTNKKTYYFVYYGICRGRHELISTQNTNTPPECTIKMSPPYYGSKTQWETNERKKPILIPEDRKYILKVLGKFLYYARAVGRTIMIALVTLEAAKSKVT